MKLGHLVLIAALVTGGTGFTVLAQDAGKAAPAPAAEKPSPETLRTWRDRMRKLGASDAMMRRCLMMSRARIDAWDTSAVLALAGELSLTPEQAAKLTELSKKNREAVKALLDEKQKSALAELEKTPACAAGMGRWMMDRIKQARKRGAWSDTRDGCAMEMMTMACPMGNDMPCCRDRGPWCGRDRAPSRRGGCRGR